MEWQTLLKTRLGARICVSAFVIMFAVTGCRTRTVYVPDGYPMRLRETVRNVKVWALDKNGKWVKGKEDLPEGFYVLADPGAATP